MQQGKPSGLAKNARGGICPAGRDRTFEGVPMYGGGGRIYCFFFIYANKIAKLDDLLAYIIYFASIVCLVSCSRRYKKQGA